jgi:hypothetical protein
MAPAPTWPRHGPGADRRTPAAAPLPPAGFGNCSGDYEAPFGCAEEGLATLLRERGWHVTVLDIRRTDWFNVARSLLTLGVWRGALTTDPGYSW